MKCTQETGWFIPQQNAHRFGDAIGSIKVAIAALKAHDMYRQSELLDRACDYLESLRPLQVYLPATETVEVEV